MFITLLGLSAVYGFAYFWLGYKKKEKLLNRFLGDSAFSFIAILSNIVLANLSMSLGNNGFILKYLLIPLLKTLANHPEFFVASSVFIVFSLAITEEIIHLSQKKNNWIECVGNVLVRSYGIAFAVILSCYAFASYQGLMWTIALLKMLGVL